MDYEDMIKPEKDPDTLVVEPPYDTAEVEAVAPDVVRQGASWKVLLLTGLLSGLIGAGGGAYAVYEGLKAQTPDVEMPDMAAATAPLEQKIAALETRLAVTERATEQATNRVAEAPAIDLTPLEDRLIALETAPSPDIDPDALSALQAAQADGFDWPDTSELEARLSGLEAQMEVQGEATLPEDLEARLAALESLDAVGSDAMASYLSDRIAALENKTSAPAPTVVIRRMDTLEARLEALESAPAPAPIIRTQAVLAFPKDAMLKAVDAASEGGLLSRTLSRHVRVKDADNPRTLIDGIEADIAAGRLEAAANKFERLPSPVRAAGQAWYDSVKATF